MAAKLGVMTAPVTAIIGVGPGNGAAFARRFSSEGHRVALLSRSVHELERLAEGLPGESSVFACDAADPASVTEALGAAKSRFGSIDCLLYNAGAGAFGSVDDVQAEDLERAWRVNALGLFAATQAVLPDMRAEGAGSIVVTGATASVRGGAGFLAFAQAKAAQRSLAESLARKLGPEGIHVALVILDGVVDLERTRAQMPGRPPEAFLQPDDIAEAVWFLTRQPRSAWTFQLDLRPHVERW